MAVDDFNNDGLPDIFAGCTDWPGANEKPSYMYRVSNWAGAMGPTPNFAAGGTPLDTGEKSRAVAVSDFDRDGNLDIFVASEGADTNVLMLGTPDPGHHVLQRE